jgi:hypothetical protein
MTTAEKLQNVLAEAGAFDLFSIDPKTVKPELRDAVLVAQSICGNAGIDPGQLIALAIPTDEREADILVDKAIAFLFELRGDELPPFDPDRYGEAQAA